MRRETFEFEVKYDGGMIRYFYCESIHEAYCVAYITALQYAQKTDIEEIIQYKMVSERHVVAVFMNPHIVYSVSEAKISQ